MIKILEAVALFILGNVMSKPHAHHHQGIGAEFFASKGRIIILSLVAGITLSILFAGGLILAFVGASFWMSDESVTSAHWLVYNGIALSVIAGIGVSIAFSKKRFNLEPEKEKSVALQPSSIQAMEEIALSVIKDFIKETKPKTTAAAHPPASAHTA
jgi:hypothetical protein